MFLKDVRVKAYDLEKEPTKSLHADPRYPFYVHTTFRFYQYSDSEITSIERSALEMTLSNIAGVKNVSGSADVIEISSVKSFNPKGDKGGKGASTNVETKVYVVMYQVDINLNLKLTATVTIGRQLRNCLRKAL